MTIVEPIKLTKDMIGDLFETRVGEVVCLTGWSVGGYPAVFTDDHRRTVSGAYWGLGDGQRDLVRHLPRSKYPEYYL